MNRHVLGASLALAAILGTLGLATSAFAAATIHKFSVEIGGGAAQIAAGDFNNDLTFKNRILALRGLQGFDQITYSFMFDIGGRYFIRPNFALNVGLGQMKNQSKREYLPAIREDIQLRAEILSVPIHVGGDYYFTPYNQGDFQARAFMGGGLLDLVNNRVLFQSFESGTDSVTTLDPNHVPANASKVQSWGQNAPGWYGEVGVHMFFALRYSVVLNAYYRSAKVQQLVDTATKQPLYTVDGKPFGLDLSGIGARGALCIGF